jgi:hypothetical protein
MPSQPTVIPRPWASPMTEARIVWLPGIGQVADEDFIELDRVDLERIEVAKRGVSSPEVIDGELHPKVLELAKHDERTFLVSNEHPLSDLEGQ